MQNLGVYWAPVLGNHDTESYAVYNRRYIGKYYQEQKFAKAGSKSYCLFCSGPEGVDGVGNYTVAVENRRGAVTQALFLPIPAAMWTATTWALCGSMTVCTRTKWTGTWTRWKP